MSATCLRIVVVVGGEVAVLRRVWKEKGVGRPKCFLWRVGGGFGGWWFAGVWGGDVGRLGGGFFVQKPEREGVSAVRLNVCGGSTKGGVRGRARRADYFAVQ